MEWNVKTPSWDWESMVVFNGRVSETSKQEKRMDWGIEGDGGVDNGSVCSPGGGGYSGSELGNGSSSKSSISASVDSSLKTGIRVSEFSLQKVEGFPKELNEKKEVGGLEDAETSPELVSSVGTHEPLIGLKLGKRTYFEDVCTGTAVKVNSSFSVASTSSNNHVKKPRASCQSNQTSRCQVEGCNLDLSSAKDYHRKHRVCENHSKCSKVIVAGQERRFCQQCSRFHELAEFDEKKRSCRRRLSDHNARRRKPQSDTISFNSTRLPTPLHAHADGRQQMNFVLNRFPLIHARPAVNPSWSGSCELKFAQAKGSWLRATKAGGTNGQLHMTDVELPTVSPTVCHDLDKQLPYKGTIADVLNQGVEAPMAMSNIDSTMDFRRALSLLSNNSWGSGHTEPASLNQIINLNQTSTSQPTIQAVHQPLPVASTESWQPELLSAESRAPSVALHGNAGQFHEFQRFKAPYDSVFLDNHSMH